MSSAGDEDDWIGTPPEGRHPPGTAKPEFWRNQRPVLAIGAGLAFVIAALLLALLT